MLKLQLVYVNLFLYITTAYTSQAWPPSVALGQYLGGSRVWVQPWSWIFFPSLLSHLISFVRLIGSYGYG